MRLSYQYYTSLLNVFEYGAFLFGVNDSRDQQIELFYINQQLADMFGITKSIIKTEPGHFISQLNIAAAKDYHGFIGQLVEAIDDEPFEYQSAYLDRLFICYSFKFDAINHMCLVLDVEEFIKDYDLTFTNKEDVGKYRLKQIEHIFSVQAEMIRRSQYQMRNLIERLNKAQSIAHIGNWEYNILEKSLWASEEAYTIFGLDKKDAHMDMDMIARIIHPDDIDRFQMHLEQMAVGTTNLSDHFRFYYPRNKELRYFYSFTEPKFNDKHELISITGVVQDTTERAAYENMLIEKNENITLLYEELLVKQKALEKQYSETQFHKSKYELSENRYQTLVDGSQDVIYSCDVNSYILAANYRFCQLFNISKEDVIGKNALYFFDYSTVYKTWKTAFDQAIKEKRLVAIEQSYEDNGTIKTFDITFSPIINPQKQVIGVTVTKHNITVMRYNEEKIKHLSMHDVLTNLPNRNALFDKLSVEIQENLEEEKLALMFIDMDNFKKVNDTIGHQAGDELLKAVGRRLSSCLRAKDFIARLSGDEFAILLIGIDQNKDVSIIIDRIQKKINQSFKINNNDIELSVSMGIAFFPTDATSAEELLKCADTAMHKTKDIGRNSYSFYSGEMRHEVLSRMKYETRLKAALTNDEFQLYYQPQFTVDNKLRGFEALIRWNSPALGMVPPLDFIPIAEETGLIHNIGEWVIDTAIKQCKEWEENYDFLGVMAINISPIQLQKATFIKDIVSIINSYNLGSHQIELEVTESLFIDNYDMALSVLEALQAEGFRIALDDFGTGYSSLSYLKRLPINLLKIDKSFISELDFEKPEENITESIISLVHKLNIETIAEGVETVEQMNYLVHANCDNMQGYHLGRPMDAQAAEEVLKTFQKVR